MIIEYFRPKTLEKTLNLLTREKPATYPLGGGTVLNQRKHEQFAVVDLQELGLNVVNIRKDKLRIGATTTLQKLFTYKEVYPALRKAIRHEANINIRQVATVAGSLIACNGRSPFVTAMLALGAQLWFYPDDGPVGLGELLPYPEEKIKGRLVTEVTISTNIKFVYKYVARTPADLPVVCVGVAQWPSGRTRVALGGYGPSPILAFDGPNDIGADLAAGNLYLEAGDPWGSARFRSEIAAILVKRCLEQIKS